MNNKFGYLKGDGILPSNQRQIIKQAKFKYSPLGKALEKQTQKQIDASKFLNLSNKINGLKRIEGVFPKDLPAQ